MAQTEEKKYLVNVESNIDDYVKDVQDAAKATDEWKEKQKEAEKQHGKNSKEYIEATANLKVAQKEQKQATATLEKMTAAQKASGTSYNALYKQWAASEAKLKALEGTLVRNADGTIVLTEEYKKAKLEVEQAKNALNEFTLGVKDGRNNVGLYGDAIKGAFADMGSQIGSVIPGFDKLGQGLQMAKLGFTSLRGAIMATGIGALVIALMGLFQYFTKTKDGATFLSKATAALGAAFDTLMAVVKPLGSWLVSVFTEPKKALKDLGDFLQNQIIVRFNGLKKILQGIIMTLKGDFQGGLKAMGEGASDAITGVENFRAKVAKLGSDMVAAAKAAAALAQAQADLAQKNVDSTYTLAQLSKQAETYRAIADDDTRSFKERQEAAEKADAANRRMMAMRVQLAREAYRLAELELKQQMKAGKDTIEIQQKAADSYAALKEAETAYNTSVINSNMIQQKIESDKLELMLDSIEKGLDGIKAANISAINDDRRTVAERMVILKALTKTRDEAIANEVKLIEHFSKKQINLTDLVATKDAVALKEKIDGYRLSEKATIRLQDIVKNAQDTNTEFAEAQKSLDEKALARKIAFTNKEKELIDSTAAANREAMNKTAIANVELTAQTQANVANATIKNADELSLRMQEIEMTKQLALRDIQLQQQNETALIAEQQRNDKAVAEITQMQLEEGQKAQLLKDNEELNRANLMQIETEYNNQRKANAAQTEADITNKQKLEISLRRKALEGSLQVASDVFGTMSELVGKQTAVGKAFAITQAIINTYSSAVAAYNSAAQIPFVGYVLGPIAAAGAIAAGLKNVQAIKSASTGGGASGGGSASGQTVSASFTAANQNIATSRVQNANNDRLQQAQQNASQNATATGVNSDKPIIANVSVEAYQTAADKKNRIESNSNF